MWDKGYDAGFKAGALCCLGGGRSDLPDFDSSDEEADYENGYEAGYQHATAND